MPAFTSIALIGLGAAAAGAAVAANKNDKKKTLLNQSGARTAAEQTVGTQAAGSQTVGAQATGRQQTILNRRDDRGGNTVGQGQGRTGHENTVGGAGRTSEGREITGRAVPRGSATADTATPATPPSTTASASAGMAAAKAAGERARKRAAAGGMALTRAQTGLKPAGLRLVPRSLLGS